MDMMVNRVIEGATGVREISMSSYEPISTSPFERVLTRMLMVAFIMSFGCLSACLGSIAVFLLRFRWTDMTPGAALEAGRNARGNAHGSAHGDKKYSPEEIAAQACSIAFERMGLRPVDDARPSDSRQQGPQGLPSEPNPSGAECHTRKPSTMRCVLIQEFPNPPLRGPESDDPT